MNSYISMLRGVNVGGHKKIPMAALREVYSSLGLANVVSYVQSGNVIFDSAEPDAAWLARQIEAQIVPTFGFGTAVFIRTAADLQRIIANNPFLQQRNENPAGLHVVFLEQRPLATQLHNLIPPPGETAQFQVGDQEIYLCFPNGSAQSKLSNNFFEQKLGLAATTRNWNTVTALYQLVTKR